MKTITALLLTRARIGTLAIAVLFSQSPLSAAGKNVASFETDESLNSWTAVNDGVMGGISKGGFKRSDQGTLLFTGDLSLENNGGFASIRMKPSALGLAGRSALVVKARGDGRTYWVDLRVTDQMSASSYRAYLPTTAGKWQETRIPFADFKLQSFGREVPVKPIDAAAVASVGFTLADKKAGPFALEIGAVKATGGDEECEPVQSGKTLVDVAKAAGGFKTLLAAATAADLVGVLAGEGPLTVLAPTDEAFAKLPSGTVETLLKPENRAELVAILKNHVLAGRVTLAKALEVREASSLQGAKIAFKFEEGRVRVGPAALVTADIGAANGVIHVIDQVLIPLATDTGPLSPSGLIGLAIDRGVPIFNNGDVAGCAALYEVTAEALRTMSSVPEVSRKVLARAIQEARAEKSARQQAWILRAALDQTMASL